MWDVRVMLCGMHGIPSSRDVKIVIILAVGCAGCDEVTDGCDIRGR